MINNKCALSIYEKRHVLLSTYTERPHNMPIKEQLIKDVMMLKPFEKARLIDHLISSLDQPDKDIDELWANEAESRIDAYERGKMKSIPLDDILKKYK